ncbi:type II toxin-antitoxin system PemK/MazF family toxin [Cytobacillus horneckiae]|uniref:type II toxin-antitoxin system PemK/MazF family toxin n=1 Tax=Cytobacillus horneckiae TaxID=549687 RepID=UPI0034CE6D3E
MEIQAGDIFWSQVYYPSTGKTATRPIVVYGFDDGNPLICQFTIITTRKIKDFDQHIEKWKVPLFKWQQAGLREPSYAKVNCLAAVNSPDLLKLDYIGRLDRTDLKRVQNEIVEFINSDDEAW